MNDNGAGDTEQDVLRDYLREDDEAKEEVVHAGEVVADEADGGVQQPTWSDLAPVPPREDRRPRPVPDDPSSVQIAYCVRWQTTGDNPTVRMNAATQVEEVCVCSDCTKALAGM